MAAYFHLRNDGRQSFARQLGLRSQGRPSNAALETFGPGYLLMAAWYLMRKRWFGKAPTTS